MTAQELIDILSHCNSDLPVLFYNTNSDLFLTPTLISSSDTKIIINVE